MAQIYAYNYNVPLSTSYEADSLPFSMIFPGKLSLFKEQETTIIQQLFAEGEVIIGEHSLRQGQGEYSP